MRFDIVTLFPEIFSGYVSESILKKALDRELIEIAIWNLRDWSRDKHQRVDDRPYGGGPGMVIRVEPVVECVAHLRGGAREADRLILLAPHGRRLTQADIEEFAGDQRLILLCGRYEGFDHRVSEVLRPDVVSLGDFVLNGGEVAAMAIVDAVLRLVPGVLGDDRSAREDSFSLPGRELEFEQYTRPRDYQGHVVPEILLSGNHEEIRKWREARSQLRTHERHPPRSSNVPETN